MGLREASVRHPNVVVMAPALTETAQSQNFKFASTVSLSLKDHLKKAADVITTNGGMNGHSTTPSPPSNRRTTSFNINGIVKNLKNEFLQLNSTAEDDDQQQQQDEDDETGGYDTTMNAEDSTTSTMGMMMKTQLTTSVTSNDAAAEMLKNLAVINSEELGSTELGGQVEEILEAIQGSGEFEFEKDLFDVDVMNIDDTLVAVNKEALIDERIEEARKKYFLVTRKCEFLERRLKKLEARTLGKHAAEELTGVIEYTTNLYESSNRGNSRLAASAASTANDVATKSIPFSSMSLFMRQMDHAANQQASNVVKSSVKSFKYFGSGSSSNSLITTSNGLRSSLPGSILPPYKPEIQHEIEVISGELHCQLYKADKEIDSDATETSSGGESADEHVPYSNPHQHPLSINKRCLWRWLEERASVASRWTWLQSQIADLEYRIRQQNEIRRQMRTAKGKIDFEDPLNEDKCARTRPLLTSSFAKRKVVQLSGLHRLNKKVARPASLRCACRGGVSAGNSTASSTAGTSDHSCGLCTGRAEPTCPRDPLELAPVQERVALLDPSFHPVLSFPSDVSASLHYDSLMKCPDWQLRASRIRTTNLTGAYQHHVNNDISSVDGVSGENRRGRKPSASLTTTMINNSLHNNSTPLLQDHHLDLERSKAAALAVSHKLRRKIARGRRRKKNVPLERSKYRRKFSGPGYGSSTGDNDGLEYGDMDINDSNLRYPSPVPSPAPSAASKDKEPSNMKRKRENSYDIDNIVIPYSMASATRLEKLTYKEILTPKWRRIKDEEYSKDPDHKNGLVRRSSREEGYDDMSDEAFIIRHERCEIEERKKFLSYLKVPNSGTGGMAGNNRGRGQRRTDSRAESSGPNTPDPMSPGGSREGGDSLTSPPATPQADYSDQQPSSSSLSSRRRTVSASKTSGDQVYVEYVNEVAPYEVRQFPLSEETFKKMLSENSEAHQIPYPAYDPHFSKQYDLESVESPQSVTTDSADSLLGEDPNDPEWTSADRTTNHKR